MYGCENNGNRLPRTHTFIKRVYLNENKEYAAQKKHLGTNTRSMAELEYKTLMVK